jgi:hypothetical protein
MSIDDVAPVFERINSTGTRLTIYDLMRAATWSQEFDLGATIEDITSSLEAKAFHRLDNKTFLRALGAAAGPDFSASSIDALRDLTREKLAEAAAETKRSAQLAADFLATQIGAPRSEALPYANQFAVLCEIFRVLPRPNSTQLLQIKYWFWQTTLAGYFGGWDSGQMTQDARRIRRFAKSEVVTLQENVVVPTASLWRAKPFRSNSAVSKMLGLMLGHGEPLDLVNGQRIDVDRSLAWSNDKEYHHFFPQAYLARQKIGASGSNLVANIVLLTSKSNIEIRDKAPSQYLAEIIYEVGVEILVERLESNMVPREALDAALVDDYDSFLTLRAEHLHRHARELAGDEVALDKLDPDEVDDSADDTTE